MKKFLISFLALLFSILLQAGDGSITNIHVEQRPDGSGLFDVYFDLNGAGTNYFIQLAVSFDGGSYSSINSVYTNGDVGPINPGNNKHIVWNGLLSHPNSYSDQAQLRITATTGTFLNTGTPCPGMPTVTYEGKTYNTILIGDQCWLKENLNVGVMIQAGIAQTDNGIIEKYCYNNDEINCDIYGGLYQWNEAMQYVTTPGAQGICPPGWHIPTDEEWMVLEGTVDSQYEVDNPIWETTGDRGFDVGKNLKSTNNWSSGGNGVDYYGFSALPGGYVSGATSLSIGFRGYWWTSDPLTESFKLKREIDRLRDDVNRSNLSHTRGLSVRCIRD